MLNKIALIVVGTGFVFATMVNTDVKNVTGVLNLANMHHTILNDLPTGHPLRNKPLFDIGVMYRWKHSQLWLPIGPKFGIGKKTFNELGNVWVDNDYFGVNEE